MDYSRRQLLGAGAGAIGLTALAAAFSPAYAQSASIRSVEDVISGGRFIKINKSTLDAQIAEGKSVLLYYSEGPNPNSPSGRLAQILAEISNREELRDMKFLVYRALSGDLTAEEAIQKFGFAEYPSVIYFKNGRRLASHYGGPTSDTEFNRIRAQINNNVRHLSTL
ncbi:hypothetical protein HYV81_02825 [Candidatus Woesearchaeota archaeon]|nr:hypothetical protein [Candidatus Woesearchaeota archaeon]